MYECINEICVAFDQGVRFGILPALLIGGMAGASAIKGVTDYYSAREKRRAEEKAAKRAQKINEEGMRSAEGSLSAGYGNALENVMRTGNLSRGALSEANTRAGQALTSGRDLARSDLESGFGQARSDLSSGYGSARRGLQSMADLAHYGEDALTGKGFTESGGYQFRLGQGNKALANKQAASGGRLSGAAMKALTDYNSGMASQEFGNWSDRAMQLGQTGYGAQGRQADYMAQEGQGLAGLSTARGGALGQLESNFGGNMASMNERYGSNLSNQYGQEGTQIANLQSGLGTSLANAATGNANANAALQFSGTGGAGAGYDAAGNAISDFSQLMAAGYGAGMFNGGGQTKPGSMSTQIVGPPQRIGG